MAELLINIIIILIGGAIIGFAFKDSKYAFAFAIGNIISDFISIGLKGIKFGSLDPKVVIANEGAQHLALFGSSAINWIILSLLFLGIVYLLYKFDKIEKSTFISWFLMVTFFVVGVAVHIIVDVLLV